MARTRKSTTEPLWHVTVWHNRVSFSTRACSSLEHALQASYRIFADGTGFPEAIVTPEQRHISYPDDDVAHDDMELREGTHTEDLLTLWDEWLERHPDARATWDTIPRTARLHALAEQHMPDPRPFSSEAIVADPARYRRIYGILGMTDEVFETFLSLHRFAIAQKQARQLAREEAQAAPRPPRGTIAAIYLRGYSTDPDRSIVPLATQERACRAYCKRVGYKVHRVYRATTPPPDHVPLKEEIGIVPGEAFEYYRRDSKHPYHEVHNLLGARTIDLMVEFKAGGPSSRRSVDEYEDESQEESSRVLRIEWASLWEIEPPTDEERQIDKLVTAITRAQTEEEGDALMEQLRVLTQNVAVKRPTPTTPATTPTSTPVPAAPEVPVILEHPTLCFACHTHPARVGSAFCSDACAQAAAERLVQATSRGWCTVCGRWIGREGCPHTN